MTLRARFPTAELKFYLMTRTKKGNTMVTSEKGVYKSLNMLFETIVLGNSRSL